MNPAGGFVAMNPAGGFVAMNPARGFVATNPGAWIRDGISSVEKCASWVHCQPNHMSWVHCEPSRASWVHPGFAMNPGAWVHHKPASWVRLKNPEISPSLQKPRSGRFSPPLSVSCSLWVGDFWACFRREFPSFHAVGLPSTKSGFACWKIVGKLTAPPSLNFINCLLPCVSELCWKNGEIPIVVIFGEKSRELASGLPILEVGVSVHVVVTVHCTVHSGRFITLAVTYRGDVYFVPVLYPFFMIALVGML
ncbi:hypothetical protein SLEP1_g42742 [Rubroshorea leprosula]|uniref:Uncharacterized protein n=1 Tax=Rubroshorea leprosula TaxID=152421 RepID=A0AAV5LBC8_9ROSI|nr:hypothetical protein SLEP1_g42742 [Rubroshorea leprosula]